MTDHLVTPEKTIEIAGKTYTLDGGFKALKAIQHATEIEILRFIKHEVASYPFDKLARVIAIGIQHSGQSAPPLESIEQAIVDDIGISEARFIVMEWLIIATSPKAERQKKALELAEMYAKTKEPSPGATTSASPPES
jgi:hypothetical protein